MSAQLVQAPASGLVFCAFVLAAYLPQLTMMWLLFALFFRVITLLLLVSAVWIPFQGWQVGAVVAGFLVLWR